MQEWIWWSALAVVGVSAVAHLVSMLGTRWGDRRASAKALVFSLLLHAAVFCGVFAITPTIRRLAADRDVPAEPEAVVVREFMPDDTPDEPSEGEKRAWDRPVESSMPVRPRSELDRELAELPAIDREQRPREEPRPEFSPAETVLPESAAEPEVVPFEPTAPPVVAAPMDTPQTNVAERREESPGTTPLRSQPNRELAALPTPLRPRESSASMPVPQSVFEPAEMGLPKPVSVPETPEFLPPEGIAARPAPATPVPTEAVPAPERQESRRADLGLLTRRGTRPTSPTDSSEPQRQTPAAPVGNFPSALRPERELASLPSRFPELDRNAMPGSVRPEDTGPRRRQFIPETYRQRSLDQRKEATRQNGGTEVSEAAVEAALVWLAAHQTAAGYWDADANGAGLVGVDETGVDRKYAGKTADAGLTGLSLLAFLGAGYTQHEGRYAGTIDRALSWLVKNQRDDGFLAEGAAHFEQMYCHGIATYALAEAYSMQGGSRGDSPLKEPLERAVNYIAAQQGRDGGWRYVKGQEGDMSMFGWQLMALKSAEIAGVPTPAQTRGGMIQFLVARSLGTSNGLAAYRPNMAATAPMTAEALFSKQILGIQRDNPASQEAVAFLLDNLPKRSTLDYYYWYYGTLAMFQYGGEPWQKWNTAFRETLLAEQVRTGDDAGSWAPKDAWGPYGGRVYSTAIAALSLEVYYRFLPLYRGGGE